MINISFQFWFDGYIAGLREYAWWKDGVQYVGSCGTTLKDAINVAEKEYGLTTKTNA